MPHLRHHRRRHSWPFGSPGAQLREKRIARNSSALDPSTLAELEEHYLAPIVSEDLPDNDDAASAGIVRTKTTRSHHRWFASKHAVRHGSSGHKSTTMSGGTGSLRRMIRPPLDKARSLFVVPTTTSTGEQVVVSCWVSQADGTQPADFVTDRGRKITDGPEYLTAERNHRRCHSEQPRSWRAPSASLWTLLEE
jgi:hypothetical protein